MRKHNSQNGTYAEEELIDVERATELLKKVSNVRKIRPDHVSSLAYAITSGNWDLNGDTIKLDKSGRVIDGEHRLRAILQAEKPVRTLVAYGIQPSNTIDSGRRPRSATQLVASKGVKYAVTICSIARLALLLEDDGNLLRFAWANIKLNLTTQRLSDFSFKHLDTLEESARIVTRACQVCKLPTGSLGLIAFRSPGSPTVQAFMDSLQSGEGLRRGNPVFALRERCLNQGARRFHTKEATPLAFKAWNAYVRKEPLQVLKFGKNEEIEVPLTAS